MHLSNELQEQLADDYSEGYQAGYDYAVRDVMVIVEHVLMQSKPRASRRDMLSAISEKVDRRIC